MPKHLQFKVSSALKDIIGRDLITDDFIAVFELVKNSYDAHATRVDIVFEKLYSNNAKILIKDNGKGMSYDDIINKWLFVAYSAKKEGTEDSDYREKIYKHRPYAGAKGIGRFSCDRLGKKLRLETTKRDHETEIIYTDWEKFEENIRDEFKSINVTYTNSPKSSFNISHGTVLEIMELRSEWNRNKLLDLKDSLAKLINPSQDKSSRPFSIYIECEEEKKQDAEKLKENREFYDIVNGEVKNFIFEALEIKTSKIEVVISPDGKEITTELRDGGTLIYKITERNVFEKLFNIKFRIFYLNQSSKLTFSHRMGVNTRDYGSIFLYKNNIRIYPYGEPGEDPLKLDARKAQKAAIYLGNKDLIGRVEILGNNPNFRETSSRGDGFIKNSTYDQFFEAFYEKVIIRLEKYVIDVQKWGDGVYLSVEDDLDKLDKNEINLKITELISKLSNSEEILDVNYDDNFINIINAGQSESAISLVKNLYKLALKTDNKNLHEIASKTEKRVNELQEALSESNRFVEKTRKELKEIISENLFLKSIKSQDFDEIVSFIHHIGISAGAIDNYLSGIYKRINSGVPIPPAQLKEIVEFISFENKKIINISKFATKANFKLYSEEITADIGEYIKEYIGNIVQSMTNESLEISFDNYLRKILMLFKPIEINILIDNLINNSKKANASFVRITLEKRDNMVELRFLDDGIGINKNAEKIFDFGYTTTSGSGLGLFHVKKIVDGLNGKIVVNNNLKKGVEFIIQIPIK